MTIPFKDRRAAGQALARELSETIERDDTETIVLALPRGGVPVAQEVANALGVPLDLLLVRKLGVPGYKELAMGAITARARILNEDVLRRYAVTDEDLAAETAAERAELDRRALRYRGDKPWPDLHGRRVILVDDGIATGATMEAAARAVRAEAPAELIVAVPVAPPDVVARFTPLADRFVCLELPTEFWAIGAWYQRFDQLSDEEVLDALGGDPAANRPDGEAN